MAVHADKFEEIRKELGDAGVELVAVSKTKSVEEIQALYDLGQRDFGENYVQELIQKSEVLPKDIRWHFIGHLQTNKVRYIAPFVHLIHGVDSLKLLKEVNKQGMKLQRTIQVLLQVHIAREETKFGMDSHELQQAMLETGNLEWVKIRGLMGMASFVNDPGQIKQEFGILRALFEEYKVKHQEFTILSMGMSGDYKLAIEEGSTLVRIGSLLFGSR